MQVDSYLLIHIILCFVFRENLLPPSAAAHHMATCRVIIAWHKTKHFADTVTAEMPVLTSYLHTCLC